jgi:ligand-binding sensor domain-containing protein
MSRQKVYLLAILGLFLLAGCEKDNTALDPYSFGKWTTITTTQGLGSNSIWCLFVDSQGNLWVGTTENGVSRFDGKVWAIFNTSDGLIDNTVMSIEEDVNGNMWFGTLGGFSIYNGTSFESYTGAGGDLWQVMAMKQAKNGSMWMGTFALGLFEITTENIYQYYSSTNDKANNINAITEDKLGNIWAATDSGVYKITSSDVLFYNSDDGLTSDKVNAVFSDSWGQVWLGTNEAEYISRYYSGTFQDISLYNGMPENVVLSFCEDKRGRVWIGLISNGAIMYDGTIMQSYFKEDGLAGNTITSIAEDHKGNLWFGTNGYGLTKYAPELE